MEELKERLELFYQQEFFQKYPGLAEAIVDHEIKIGLKLPNDFVIPPFIHYEIGENKVLLGKVHTHYLFALVVQEAKNYRLFESKSAFKLFFTQMNGLEKTDLAFWLTEIEDIDFNIKKIIDSGKEA